MTTLAQEHETRLFLIDEIVAQLSDHPQSLAELCARIGEEARPILLAMVSAGGAQEIHAGDVVLYGVGG